MQNEKADYESQQAEIQSLLEELVHCCNIQDLEEIEARFNTSIPIKATKSLKNVQNELNKDKYGSNPYFTQLKSKLIGVGKSEKEQMFNHNIDLTEQLWFHGVLPRKDVEEDLLKEDGDFLVRVNFLLFLFVSIDKF